MGPNLGRPTFMINIRQKGAEGERQVAKVLNAIIQKVLTEQQWPAEVIAGAENCVQRNQNQSAVGGCDLSNVFGLAVEVKRQEQLSIGTWWKQTVASAIRNREVPVLIYRQNQQKWSVVMYLHNPLPVLTLESEGQSKYSSQSMRAEISWDDFQSWFEQWVRRKLLNGEYPRV